MNARKIYGEPDVLQGLGDNMLFVYILGGEVALQVRLALTAIPWCTGFLSPCCVSEK